MISSLNQKRTDMLSAFDANQDESSIQEIAEILARSDVDAVSKAADAVI